MRFFLTPPGILLLKLMMVTCGRVMPFLEILPFTGSLMASVVLFLAIALLTCDGLFAAIGIGCLAATVGVAVWLI